MLKNQLIFSLLLIFSALFSCNNKNEKLVESEILEVLNHDTSIINKNNELLFLYLQKKTDISPGKILRYYLIAKDIRYKSYELRNLINNSTNLKGIQDSVNSYKLVLSQAKALNLFHLENSINSDTFFSYKILNPKQNQTFYKNQNPNILINKIIIAENQTLKAILNQTSHVDGPFSKIKLFVIDEEKVIRPGNYYTFLIIPNNISEESNAKLQVDYISKDGNKIETRVIANWEKGIGKIKIYTQKEGIYQFTGRIIFKDDWGINSAPFQGSFTVEN